LKQNLILGFIFVSFFSFGSILTIWPPTLIFVILNSINNSN